MVPVDHHRDCDNNYAVQSLGFPIVWQLVNMDWHEAIEYPIADTVYLLLLLTHIHGNYHLRYQGPDIVQKMSNRCSHCCHCYYCYHCCHCFFAFGWAERGFFENACAVDPV